MKSWIVAGCLLAACNALPVSAQEAMVVADAANATPPAATTRGGDSGEEGDKPSSSPALSLLGGTNKLLQQSLQYQLGQAYGSGDVVLNRLQYGLAFENDYGSDYLLRFEARAYGAMGSDHQRLAEQNPVALRGEIRDLYVQKNIGATTVKLGRQYVNWSEMEALGFLGDVNPRDFNEWVYQSITDSSITETRLTVDHYGDAGRLTMFYTPASRPHIRARTGSKYDLEAAIFDPAQFSVESNLHRQPEFGARYMVSTERADLGLIYSRLVSNDPVYAVLSDTGPRIAVNRVYDAYDLYAISANRSFGRWTFRTETGYERGRAFQVADALMPTDSTPRIRDQVNVVLSGEYLSQTNALYHAEYSERRIRHGSDDIGRHRNKREFFLLYRSGFFRDLVDLEYTYYRELRDKLAIHRLKVFYDIDDKTKVGIQLDRYLIPRRDVLPLGDLNRAALTLAYVF